MNYQRFLNQKKVQIVLVLVLSFFAFASSLQNGFTGDDFEFILGWQKAHSFASIVDLLAGAVPQTGQHQGVYRPISNILGALYFQVFDNNPFGYHLVAIVIHLGVTILVYLIANLLTKNKLVSFLTSLLFGLHPVHSEAVVSVTPSIGLMGTLFFFLSFYFYLKMREGKNLMFYVYSMFSAIVAFFSHEFTLMLPILLLFYEFLFVKRKPRFHIRNSRFYIVPYFLLAGLYVFARISFVGTGGRGEYVGGSLLAMIIAMLKSLLVYFKIILWPFDLSVSYKLPGGVETLGDFPSLAKMPGVFALDFWVYLSGAIILFSVLLFFRFIKKHPVISFSIAWFYLNLVPVSNIIPGVTLLAARYLYIAAFGTFLLFAYVANIAWNKLKENEAKSIVVFVLFLIFALLFSSTYFLNKTWHDPLTLWSYAVSKSPNNAAAHYNLANIYQKVGDFEKAALEYQKTLESDPTHPGAHNNLASYLFSQGKPDDAEFHYQKALEYGGEVWIIYFNLGNLYAQIGKLDLAKENYKKAIELNPDLKLDLDKLQRKE